MTIGLLELYIPSQTRGIILPWFTKGINIGGILANHTTVDINPEHKGMYDPIIQQTSNK